MNLRIDLVFVHEEHAFGTICFSACSDTFYVKQLHTPPSRYPADQKIVECIH